MTLAELLLAFEGRARRRDVWMGLLALGMTAALFAVVAVPWIGGRWTWLVVSLALAWPLAALLAKRYHDRDRAAWPRLLAWFGPMALVTVLQQLEIGYAWSGGIAFPYELMAGVLPLGLARTLPNALSLLAAALATFGVLESLLMPGTAGANRFGRDPRIGVAAG